MYDSMIQYIACKERFGQINGESREGGERKEGERDVRGRVHNPTDGFHHHIVN